MLGLQLVLSKTIRVWEIMSSWSSRLGGDQETYYIQIDLEESMEYT